MNFAVDAKIGGREFTFVSDRGYIEVFDVTEWKEPIPPPEEWRFHITPSQVASLVDRYLAKRAG